MTTVSNRNPMASRGIRADEHPQWIRAFRDESRMEQLDDDHRAWTAVTGTLITIVTLGVMLAIISVAICLAS